jgi:hypothetical protein
MRDKNIAVFGIYPNRTDALAAVETLKSAGFRNTDISVLLPDNPGTKDLALEKETKAPEGATAGGITGGVIGGALAWLAGIGALSIPGIGPFIAAGPIMGVLGGIGVGGALGGLAGALIGLGIPEYEAKRYEGRIRKGGILLSVHCDNIDWVKRAKSILDQTGAEDISSAQEAKADFASTDRPMSRALSTPAAARENDPELPLKKQATDGAPVSPDDSPNHLPGLKTPL